MTPIPTFWETDPSPLYTEATSDRLPPGERVMTQEPVADLLGVRRESINEAAMKLRDAGLIGYRRGHITILDPIGLESCACECYGVVKKDNELTRTPGIFVAAFTESPNSI